MQWGSQSVGVKSNLLRKLLSQKKHLDWISGKSRRKTSCEVDRSHKILKIRLKRSFTKNIGASKIYAHAKGGCVAQMGFQLSSPGFESQPPKNCQMIFRAADQKLYF